MKKWIICILLAVCTATSASAQWWKQGSGGKAEQPPAKLQEMHEKMKAERKATRQLAEAARNETDPEKKAKLIDQLREKVTENMEKMKAEFRERLEKMNERLAEEEKNKEQRIEQRVQDLLDGKKPERQKGKGSRRKGRSATAE